MQVQDQDTQFLFKIVQNCEGRKECDGSDPSGVRCDNYYLCFPYEATKEVRKAQADKIKKFKRAMKKLEKASQFLEDMLDTLHLAL
jgi:hypothetical protein